MSHSSGLNNTSTQPFFQTYSIHWFIQTPALFLLNLKSKINTTCEIWNAEKYHQIFTDKWVKGLFTTQIY